MTGRIGIFLDRDGTINEEVDYLRTPDAVRLLPGSAEAIREANSLGWATVLVTNQSGIARGFFTEQDLAQIHLRLTTMLASAGARLDAVYYCPHHPTLGNAPYRKECECRKPLPGMVLRAAAELHLDLPDSFMIGDRMADIETGINAGTRTILVLTGYGKEELNLLRQRRIPVDYVAANLAEAVQFVKQTVREKTA